MERTREKCSALLTEISAQTLRLLSKSLLLVSSLSSHPLFSIITTSSLLILLYLPSLLLPLLFSPVLISTLLLLTTLVHFGSPPPPKTHQESLPQSPNDDPIHLEPETQLGFAGFHRKMVFFEYPPPETHQETLTQPPNDDPIRLEPETESKSQMGIAGFHHKSGFYDSSVEWGRRGGPLEVIYEEYEEEEEVGEGESPEYSRSPEYSEMGTRGLGYFGFSDTDSDTESDDSPENICFRWEEEGDGLIEISLEEENLIEIDISASR